MRYRFHPEGEREHLGHVAYFEAARRGLGDRYLDDFDATIARVCEAPRRFRVVRAPDIRRALFRVFPCSVLYRDRVGHIQVLAVMHHRQRPGYWESREQA